jgi:hypothetical protein
VTSEVLYQVSDHVATTTLNAPPRMNTISGGMLDDLSTRLLEADADRDVRCIVLTGAGRAFCAGLDLAAQMSGASHALVRDARWIAAIGAAVSGPLLILDLGRPERFLNMLRVFKLQSPMSVGAWTLSLFGTASAAAAIGEGLGLRRIGDAAAFVAALSGVVMATYTGVLLGATSIPVWAAHARTLPIHFGASALASATALLELRGHDARALNVLGLAAAISETSMGVEIESDRSILSEPLRHGTTGATIRIGGFFSGPLPLALRLLGIRSKRARRAAAASALLGSLITRLGWIEAGKASAKDPRPLLD